MNLILAPVVVTAQSYQSSGQGQYPSSIQTGAASMTNAPYPHQHTMPMPQYSNVSSSTAYPTHNQMTPYTISASTLPYPTSTIYAQQATQVNPPPYSQVVGKDVYQKQPAFNPSYNS